MFTKEELDILGGLVGGTFHHYEDKENRYVPVQNGEIIVFSSNDFPAHRITALRDNCEQAIKDYREQVAAKDNVGA